MMNKYLRNCWVCNNCGLSSNMLISCKWMASGSNLSPYHDHKESE